MDEKELTQKIIASKTLLYATFFENFNQQTTSIEQLYFFKRVYVCEVLTPLGLSVLPLVERGLPKYYNASKELYDIFYVNWQDSFNKLDIAFYKVIAMSHFLEEGEREFLRKHWLSWRGNPFRIRKKEIYGHIR